MLERPDSIATPQAGGATSAARDMIREAKVDDATAAFLARLGAHAKIVAFRSGADEGTRHPGVLLGQVRGEWLLIASDSQAPFEVGDGIQVRVSLGSHLIGFESAVLVKFGDSQLFAIELPARVHALNLRKAERIPAFIPADIQLHSTAAGDTLLLKARIVDLCAGGCSFRLKTKVQRAADAKITFDLPGGKQRLTVKASVIESVRVDRVFHCRVRFTEDPQNIVPLQEVQSWVSESLGFLPAQA
jgi:PilZ domain